MWYKSSANKTVDIIKPKTTFAFITVWFLALCKYISILNIFFLDILTGIRMCLQNVCILYVQY